ncbi:MAG TPA: clostripain-related cysteine peptidase [Pyrinomonadaceae bacterium]
MKEWTLMFYFASDNPLAPGVVSQLKAIKDAGFHPEVNVITQFDPHTVGTPTHVFDVNIIEKLKRPGDADIGFGDSITPFVRNLLQDKLWRNQKTRNNDPVREEYQRLLKEYYDVDYDPPLPPRAGGQGEFETRRRRQEPNPKESLKEFLEFCRVRYPAQHYMLFILGHGVVVGNDIFLFDEHADVQSLTLKELGEVLNDFKEETNAQKAKLELISFHSCSVSALEVVYELKGTANYMLASQGPAFVGSWPYRQILIRIFKSLRRNARATRDADAARAESIRKLIIGIFYSCLYNSTDFLLAGYSFDLCLCDLNRLSDVTEPIKKLAGALGDALPYPPKPESLAVAGQYKPARLCRFGDNADLVARDLIQLAHLQAQSFWQESYTDLFDFCFCFGRLYKQYDERYGGTNWEKVKTELLGKSEAIYKACCAVMAVLEKAVLKKDEAAAYAEERDEPLALREYSNKGGGEDDKKLIVRAAFAGPAYQYSHGLSVYFPWAQPPSDNPVVEEYPKYNFAKETCWSVFLDKYFKATLRCTRKAEDQDDVHYPVCEKKSRSGAVTAQTGGEETATETKQGEERNKECKPIRWRNSGSGPEGADEAAQAGGEETATDEGG